MLLATCAPVPDQVVVAIVLSNLALIEPLSPWACSSCTQLPRMNDGNLQAQVAAAAAAATPGCEVKCKKICMKIAAVHRNEGACGFCGTSGAVVFV